MLEDTDMPSAAQDAELSQAVASPSAAALSQGEEHYEP